MIGVNGLGCIAAVRQVTVERENLARDSMQLSCSLDILPDDWKELAWGLDSTSFDFVRKLRMKNIYSKRSGNLRHSHMYEKYAPPANHLNDKQSWCIDSAPPASPATAWTSKIDGNGVDH